MKTILILFGGVSEEHDVSIKSINYLEKNFNKEKYELIKVYITKEGSWKIINHEEQEISFSMNKDRIVNIGDSTYQIDCVFPILHGKFGEDGIIQGFFETLGIPYVGCGIACSSLCMDKSLTYLVASNAGITVPKYAVIKNNEDLEVLENFKYPIFVKPSRSGSSFGISKVTSQGDLISAIKNAQKYDDKVLVEEMVEGQEVGCSILKKGNSYIFGELDEVVLKSGFFRIHQEKNPEKGSENSSFKIPANISKEKKDEIYEDAKTLFDKLGGNGLSRIDFFVRNDGEVVLNEINTFPGFTEYSRFPRMITSAGYKLSDIIDFLVEEAINYEKN